jgi:hypothetical protein
VLFGERISHQSLNRGLVVIWTLFQIVESLFVVAETTPMLLEGRFGPTNEIHDGVLELLHSCVDFVYYPINRHGCGGTEYGRRRGAAQN